MSKELKYNAKDELKELIDKALQADGSHYDYISLKLVEDHMKSFKSKIKEANPDEDQMMILSRLSSNQEFMIRELLQKLCDIKQMIGS